MLTPWTCASSPAGASSQTRLGAPEPPFGAAHERELAAVAAVHNQGLCIAALWLRAPGRGFSSDLAGRDCDARRARYPGARPAGPSVRPGKPGHGLVLRAPAVAGGT